MADRRHHSEGEHHHGYVAMPAMPGSALVVIEPELVFGGFKTVLDRPAMAFDGDQRFDGCSRWTPGSEEGEIVNRRPTWTPGRTAVTRCGETIFKKKVGVTVGRRPITPKMTNYASASMI